MSQLQLLLKVEPLDIKFQSGVRKQIDIPLQLTNKTDNRVAFIVMTTNPKKYCARPNKGIVSPYATCDITVTKLPQKKASTGIPCKDKFLIESIVPSTEATLHDVKPEMFSKFAGYVEHCRLRVAYVSPSQPPPAVTEGSEEGSSPKSALLHVENSKASEVQSLASKSTEEKTAALQQSDNLSQERDDVQIKDVNDVSRRDGKQHMEVKDVNEISQKIQTLEDAVEDVMLVNEKHIQTLEDALGNAFDGVKLVSEKYIWTLENSFEDALDCVKLVNEKHIWTLENTLEDAIDSIKLVGEKHIRTLKDALDGVKLVSEKHIWTPEDTLDGVKLISEKQIQTLEDTLENALNSVKLVNERHFRTLEDAFNVVKLVSEKYVRTLEDGLDGVKLVLQAGTVHRGEELKN